MNGDIECFDDSGRLIFKGSRDAPRFCYLLGETPVMTGAGRTSGLLSVPTGVLEVWGSATVIAIPVFTSGSSMPRVSASRYGATMVSWSVDWATMIGEGVAAGGSAYASILMFAG